MLNLIILSINQLQSYKDNLLFSAILYVFDYHHYIYLTYFDKNNRYTK